MLQSLSIPKCLAGAALMITLSAMALISPRSACADGLLYQMPKDGAYVKYDLTLEMNQGQQGMKITGTMTMAAVGTVKENDKTYRWIEFDLSMSDGNRQEHLIVKVLVLEDELKKGGKPMAKWGRGWMSESNRQAKPLTVDDLGPLPGFLASPLSDSKDLKKEVVESKLGKLECEGISGTMSYKESTSRTATVDYKEIRLHDKAPFGVVSATMNYQTQTENGPARERGTITLKLADTGDDAKTALPDNK